MKSFAIAFAFWFVLAFILSAIKSDALFGMSWSFIASLIVYVFFELYVFETNIFEVEKSKEDDEYITLFTIKKD